MEYNTFNGYSPYDGNQMDPNMPDSTLFNPAMQYEQAYMYYRYLSQQMDYKIKCKEYEKLFKSEKNTVK